MIVYIAGPYSGADANITHQNIVAAKEVAKWCAERRIRFICPHLNSAYFDLYVPETPWEFWTDMYLEILDRCCDVLLVIGDWASSRGTRKEMRRAEEIGMPIVFFESAANREWLERVNDNGEAAEDAA